MSASTMASRPGVDLSGLNINAQPVPLPGINTSREGQYLRRIKELEEENRALRIENEKNVCFDVPRRKNYSSDLKNQKAMIMKYKERWEKLKESAKRKKEAKTNATTSVKERIIEEPEAEEELDTAAKSSIP